MLCYLHNSSMAAKSKNGRHLRINGLSRFWTKTSSIGTKLCFCVKATTNHILKGVVLIF